MQLDIKEIVNGSRNGEKFWVCDFRFHEYNSHAMKPLRNVRPTEVVVVSSGLDGRYEIKVLILPLNKNGKGIKSKAIKPFDTTGHRTTGEPINVFTSEQECRYRYQQQCTEAIELLKLRKKESIDAFDSAIKKVIGYKKEWSFENNSKDINFLLSKVV